MSRFRRLHAGIQQAKKQRVGKNKELAAYCGKSKDLTSRWFWSKKPKIVPRATVTVDVLRWLCVKWGTDVVIPEWEVYRFWLFYMLFGKQYDKFLVARKLGVDLAEIECRGDSANTLRNLSALLRVTPKAFLQHAAHPWKKGAREANGEFALEIVALSFTRGFRFHFLNYLRADLEDYPYENVSQELREELRRRHAKLAASIRAHGPDYQPNAPVLPDWLTFILYPAKKQKSAGSAT